MINKIVIGDEYYPKQLLDIKDPPKQLYCDGDIKLLKSRCVSVVGSRKCTQYGATVARHIGQRVSECGVTLVSGMARGIDSAAHSGALERSGNTIAVFGCGVDVCYPKENRMLMDRIREKGLIISEFPPGSEAKPYTFPQRNRIISGLAESVVIVEAANRSGSLITAELAAEQNKNLYAVPGNITSNASFGSNKLIREGVTPLFLVDDILIDMGIFPETQTGTYLEMGEDEKKVYDLVKRNGELTIEEICYKTYLSPGAVGGIITVLEMKGAVVSSMGKVFLDQVETL